MKPNYRQEYKKDVTKIGVVLVLLSAFFCWMNKPVTITINSNNVTTNAPQLTVVALEPTIPTDIVGYINYKFGEHSEEAFKVLSCENKALNPKAINDNRTWGGVGVDRGYWQINDVYHPHVSDWCASDVKCSTDYAYRMFVNDHESFRRWTCGR